MEPWELSAREQIRDLVARYNANGDSGRFDEVVELFAPDAVMDVDGRLSVGREEIRTVFTSAASSLKEHLAARAAPSYLRHFTSTLQIDVLGPTLARARCYYQVVTAHGLDHWGRYLDEFGVVEGRWRFTKRVERLDGAVPGGWAASIHAAPAGGAPP